MKRFLSSIAAGALALTVGSAWAQAFPSKQIRLVQPFPGGSVDATARLVGDYMQKQLGQPVLIEVVQGGGGTIAARRVAESPADGYTIFFISSMQISPLFIKNNGVDVLKVFDPVSNLIEVQFLFTLTAKKPLRNLQDVIAYSKANPGKLNIAGGNTSTVALMAEALKAQTGITFTYVNFATSPAVMNAIISGEADIGIAGAGGFAPHIKSGALRGWFVSTATRAASLPEVPTATEAGVKNFDTGINIGIWAPKGTPRNAIQILSGSMAAAVKNPEIAAKLRSDAILVEPDGSTPEGQLQVHERELKFFSDAARFAKYEPQ